ncbi:hypothetical protein BBK82_36435 [Lentzea guizhouensis]|uniref:Uncharacterized protein n=1 Tax=Lentzea guizhouensis TaxID=1586287 RepID=A0A1B2HSL4_9PSEU|nr:hypothetical protein [Lentzea guizhouensis]ANZ40675.1 hypothetical protein BBK82_36435 [Lentzea guizhouensis]
MIDQLPEPRTLPDDVRVRARRRVSEGMKPGASTSTAALIAAGVSVLAAGAVFAGQALHGGAADVAAPSTVPHNGELVGKDRAVVNHVERGKVAPDVLARCAAAARSHPPVDQWQTVATSHRNGTVLTAFRVPAGVFFCANTATTTTISAPDPATIEQGRRKVKILFTTPTGAMAGLVSPDMRFLSLWRIAGSGENTTSPALVDGLFLAPDGYLRAETGTQALANGEEFAVRAVPKPAPSVVDRPLPPAARDTPQAQRFAACLTDRAVPDPDQFAHGVTAQVSATSTVVLGRFGDLLVYCLDGEDPAGASVYDVRDTDGMEIVTGSTVASVRASYDFTPLPGGGSVSTNTAAVGLLLDPRVASITFTAPGRADVPAVIGNGTFVLAAPFTDDQVEGRVVVRDAQGAVLETITPTR